MSKTSDLYFQQFHVGQMANLAYLLGSRSTGEALIVDPAWKVDTMLDRAEADGMKVVGALATHYHQDHIGGEVFGLKIEGVAQLLSRNPVPIHVNEVEADGLKLGARGRYVELAFRDIEALDYDPPFSSARRWLPALVLIDRRDRRWRIPASIEDGASMMDEIVERSGHDRLRAWADARRVDRRMAMSRWFTVAGYGAAAGWVVAATIFAWF